MVLPQTKQSKEVGVLKGLSVNGIRKGLQVVDWPKIFS
jgi:hypothetical protein